MEKIGIDVHKVASQVCIRTDEGAFVEAAHPPRSREAFAKFLGGRARARGRLATAGARRVGNGNPAHLASCRAQSPGAATPSGVTRHPSCRLIDHGLGRS